jgi:hypothetical protein
MSSILDTIYNMGQSNLHKDDKGISNEELDELIKTAKALTLFTPETLEEIRMLEDEPNRKIEVHPAHLGNKQQGE